MLHKHNTWKHSGIIVGYNKFSDWVEPYSLASLVYWVPMYESFFLSVCAHICMCACIFVCVPFHPSIRRFFPHLCSQHTVDVVCSGVVHIYTHTQYTTNHLYLSYIVAKYSYRSTTTTLKREWVEAKNTLYAHIQSRVAHIHWNSNELYHIPTSKWLSEVWGESALSYSVLAVAAVAYACGVYMLCMCRGITRQRRTTVYDVCSLD